MRLGARPGIGGGGGSPFTSGTMSRSFDDDDDEANDVCDGVDTLIVDRDSTGTGADTGTGAGLDWKDLTVRSITCVLTGFTSLLETEATIFPLWDLVLGMADGRGGGAVDDEATLMGDKEVGRLDRP